MQSFIKKEKGKITLFIDGEAVNPCAYITYMPHRARYDDFSKQGYTLYSVPLFFSSLTINESGQVPPLGDGIFDAKTPDFTQMDERIKQIVDACPNACIFPRVNVSPPAWWEDENPDELCDTAWTKRKRVCFSSDKWAQFTKDCIKIFIEHINASWYKEHICGYQIAGGNTEEWFSFDWRGSQGLRSREKYAEYLKESNCHDDEGTLYTFLSQIAAQRICEFASFVKNLTEHKLVVGAFYGYSFESPDKVSCQHALCKVLECQEVDFLCSPVSYMLDRGYGVDHPYMLPLGSLKAHGKLYFSENDTRTHLTRPPFPIPHFDKPVWYGREYNLAVENIKQHFARAFINGHALWWFDMWGGWYADERYMDLMGKLHSIMQLEVDKPHTAVTEIAVVIDERVEEGIDDETRFKVCYRTRKQLGLIGAPYDGFLFSDIDKIGDNYKAVILLVKKMSEEMQAFASSRNCLVITEENCETEVDVYRRFCKNVGVHLYLDSDAVVYANEKYLFIHSANDIKKEDVKLRYGKRLKALLGDDDNEILKKHTGYLFEIIK